MNKMPHLSDTTQETTYILYIEDNEDDFVLVEEFLPPPAFLITWSPNAQLAREKLDQEKFDLILLDHGLPDTNALSFLEEIRQRYPDLPVIVLTGYDDQALAVSAMKKGATSYLLKDEAVEHLLPTVQETLGQHLQFSSVSPVVTTSTGRFLDTADRVYRVLLETMNEGCMVATPDGIIVFANEALGKLVGEKANDLLGQTASYIFVPATRPQLEAIIRNLATDEMGQSHSFEGALLRAEGATVPVLISSRQMFEDGQYEGCLIVLTDIIELVEARQKIDALYRQEKERNYKLQLLHKIVTDASELDTMALMTHVCRLISEELGYYRVNLGIVDDRTIHVEKENQFLRGEPIRSDWLAISLDRRLTSIMTTAVNEQRTIYVPDVSQSALYLPDPDTNIASELAIPIISKQQSIAVLDVQSERVNGLDEDDILILGLMADRLAKALENAQLFQEMANERRRLSALIESSDEGIIFITPDTYMPVINSRAIALLQLPGGVADWVHKPVQDVLTLLKRQAPVFVLTVLTELQRIQEGHITPQQGEIEIQTQIIKWLNLPVSADDVSLGWLMVLRDVTKQHQAEALRQDLTHTMVHDLRTPLTGILSSLQILERLDETGRDELSERQRRSLSLSLAGSRRMLRLINRILDVSQLEEGMLPLQREPINIYHLVDTIVQGQLLIAAEKGISLKSQVSESLPAVWADSSMVERILQNLIDNAIKFTPAGGEVTVLAMWVETEAESTPHLMVEVSDTGPGISLELQGRLFQKFVTGRHQERGSGLGLAFCKLAVEAHNGRIWLETTPSKGTSFKFTIPLVEEDTL